MTRRLPISTICVLASLLGGSPVSNADTLTFSSTTDYSTGRYGEPQVTEDTYEAISGKYEFGDTMLKLTVPFLYVVGPANVVPDFGSVTNSATMRRTARSGLGDIVTTVDENVSPDEWTDTDIDIIGKVKFGTASFSKGLGTGENDYYAQIEWTQQFPFGLSSVVDGGRRFVESSAETGLHDVWYGSAGLMWQTDRVTELSIWLDMRQSAAPSSGEAVEATVQVSRTFAPGWKATLYGSKGFAPGSPDLCAGLILARAFSL